MVFGGAPARLASVGRWRVHLVGSPGMPGIFAGFALVLAGALLLVFPAAVARLEPPGSGAAARVSGRGTDVLLRRWSEAPHAPSASPVRSPGAHGAGMEKVSAMQGVLSWAAVTAYALSTVAFLAGFASSPDTLKAATRERWRYWDRPLRPGQQPGRPSPPT